MIIVDILPSKDVAIERRSLSVRIDNDGVCVIVGVQRQGVKGPEGFTGVLLATLTEVDALLAAANLARSAMLAGKASDR